MRLDRLCRRLLKVLLAYSLALLFFAQGIATVHYKIFPYGIIRDAKLAFDALVEAYAPAAEPPDAYASVEGERITVPTVRDHAGTTGTELFLVSGGNGYLKTHSPKHGCLAWLMDREGTVRHVWHYDPHLWDDHASIRRLPGTSTIYPVGVCLFGDGGLLVSFHGINCFPFAVGLARFDRDSRLIWKRELAHHWFTVAEDGRIFVPSVRVVDSPIPLGNTRAKIVSPRQKILSDTVLILDRNGNKIEEISVLDALVNSGWLGLFQGTTDINIDASSDDPTHLNDVRVVDEDLAAGFDWLSAGDLLLSFRGVNAVGILDAKTRLFKWMSAGTTLRQHSPRFFHNGILILDNLGGPEDRGGSRLVRVDLASGIPETVFPRPSQSLPGKFSTQMAGHLDVHEDGRRVLVALTDQGAIWEVDLRSGKVLWEYLYVHPNQDGHRQPLLTAKYVYPHSFPFHDERNER